MKLSIITINRNNAAGLRKTIESVVSQTYTDFEYIIIDGASTDDSVSIIKEYAEATLPCGEGLGERLYWVSEPDKGIYNAMNKGILNAKGEYLLFLNSGDWLRNDSVISDFVLNEFSQDIVYGDVNLVTSDLIKIHKSIPTNDVDIDFFFHGGTFPHQSSFIKRHLFQAYGLYNENRQIMSDREFFMQVVFLHRCSFIHWEYIVAYYDCNGISSQLKSRKNAEKEIEDVFVSNFPLISFSFFKREREIQRLNEVEREFNNFRNGKFGFIYEIIKSIKLIRKR